MLGSNRGMKREYNQVERKNDNNNCYFYGYLVQQLKEITCKGSKRILLLR